MRPIWKGHISFGLVSIPVNLYPAEQRTDLQLHLIDSENHARIRYERVNAETGEEVPWNRLVKGFEYDNGNYVVIDPDQLKQAAPEASQTVDIEAFVDLADIDLIYFDKPYFLEPVKKGEKAYALLREALRASGKAGIARVVIRTRQYLAALVPRGDALILNLLRYPQELRSAEDLHLPGDIKAEGVKKPELDMARDLIKSMSAKWDPSQYHDEYRGKLMKWIEGRIKSGQTEHIPDDDTGDEDIPAPINLMEALRKSLGKNTTAPAASTAPKKKTSKRTTKKATTKKPLRRKAG